MAICIPFDIYNRKLQIFYSKYTLENIFRSEQFALLDNASNELLFLSDFFMAKDKTLYELFNAVMGKTFNLFFVG